MNYQHYRRTMSDSVQELKGMDKVMAVPTNEDKSMDVLNTQPSTIYMAYDGDNAGRLVGRAVLANDEAALSEISSRIALGHEVVSSWVKEQGGQVISAGGDEGTFSIPAGSDAQIEQLRSDYQFTTQLTMTVGVGANIAEAGKALMVGKFRGKDQVVHYDASVDQDLAQSMDRIANGTGSQEENKLGEAYLADDVPEAPVSEGAPLAKDHADDCKYCQEHEDHSHTDDCQYCQAAESGDEETDHNHTDDCQYCAAKEEIDGHEHTDDCQWCATAEQRAADADHEHTDDCQYCAAKQASENEAIGQHLANDVMNSDPDSQSNRDEINSIDDTQMPMSTAAEDGVSRPEGYNDEASPSDMGLSEDSPEQGPDFGNVLKDGLDQHADDINREKIVGMVSQALEGFKANKQILEKAKEQAPELYSSTIAMLKAMIEMAKQLGLDKKVAQEEQEPVQPNAAPQEGAAQAPQQ